MYAPVLMVNNFNEAYDPRLYVLYQPATDDEGKVYEDSKEILGYPASADKAIALINEYNGNTEKSLRETYGC